MLLVKEVLEEELRERRRLLQEAEESIEMYKDDIERLEEEIAESLTAANLAGVLADILNFAHRYKDYGIKEGPSGHYWDGANAMARSILSKAPASLILSAGAGDQS